MHIGNVEINSQLYLAPMAGVTDMAFRQICRELGAGMSCTELVSAKALCYQDKKSRGLLKLAPNERPAAAQIFGSDIPCMAEAAVIAAEVSGADIIDINMGCPVGKVVANGDGSALMRDPEKAADYDASLKDERTVYVANKARSMAFFICIYVQLAAALLAILVFDQVLVGQVLCGLTCLQGLLYTVFYWHYDKVY